MMTIIQFCSLCGTSTHRIIPKGENRLRDVCSDSSCGLIQYQNPKLVVGTLPVFNHKILLCKRAIEPRYGYWTLPAGFMELGESCEEGALRETLEEAGASVLIKSLLSILDVPDVGQVHLFYEAELMGDYQAGEESLEVALFEYHDIPWESLAFKTVETTLRHYLSELENYHNHNLNFNTSFKNDNGFKPVQLIKTIK